MNTEHAIIECLNTTVDKHFHTPIKTLGIQAAITLEGKKNWGLELTMGFPSKLLGKPFLTELTDKLKTLLEDGSFELQLKENIKAHQTQMPGKSLRGVKNVIAVASGKGGVGKSTVTVNLAARLAKAGAKVGILDADIYGPSIPTMLGKTESVSVINDKYQPITAHGIQAMSIGYLTHDDSALIWRGPMLAKSLLQMLDMTLWDNLDYLLIDLPPGTGDIQLSLVQKIPLVGAVVVTTPQTVATLDAQKAIKMFEKTNINVLGVVENMSLHTCTACGHQEPIFGQGGAKKVCEAFHYELLGQLPLQKEIGEDCDNGQPTASKEDSALSNTMDKIALKMVASLAQQPFNYANKFPPIHVEN